MQDLCEMTWPPHWQDFVGRCRACQACDLAATRQQVVVFRGAVAAPLLILGEAPGANEDVEGRPFVGRSGRLLEQVLSELGVPAEAYHIANIVKCRPPQNRVPTPAEIKACTPWLEEQLDLVGARFIVTLGATAYRWITGEKKAPMTSLRGLWQRNDAWPQIEILPTLHPSYILRCRSQLPLFKEDLAMAWQRVQSFM